MASKVICRTRYSSVGEKPVGIIFERPSLAQQHFREECDINAIVRRYLQTGVLEHQSDAPVFYGDVSELPLTLTEAYAAVERAESAFMSLPSEVRKSINNDPAQLVDWIVNNRDMAAKFGLISAVAGNSSDVNVVSSGDTNDSTPSTSAPDGA